MSIHLYGPSVVLSKYMIAGGEERPGSCCRHNGQQGKEDEAQSGRGREELPHLRGKLQVDCHRQLVQACPCRKHNVLVAAGTVSFWH